MSKHSFCFSGAPSGARTRDPRLKRAVLYQLSYWRMGRGLTSIGTGHDSGTIFNLQPPKGCTCVCVLPLPTQKQHFFRLTTLSIRPLPQHFRSWLRPILAFRFWMPPHLPSLVWGLSVSGCQSKATAHGIVPCPHST